jgi:N-acylglucosamine-6-phosphate 2-epimerase
MRLENPMRSTEIIDSLRHQLIVSVQAYPGEPMRHPETMAQISCACELGGAAAIRCQGLSDIAAIKGCVDIPVIGLWKEGHEGVYITPTLRHARACIMAGADVVALDATARPRPDGLTFEQTVGALKDEGAILMADCASIEDIRRGFAAGCDLCSTTLSHGVAAVDCTRDDGPDLVLLHQAAQEFPGRPVVCEGRVHTPADVTAALEAGAWAVVAGTAITHPTSITAWFAEAAKA